MSTMFVVVHGFEFGINSEDWGKEERAAEHAAEHLVEQLCKLTAEQCAKLHADLKAYVRGKTLDYPALAQELGAAAFRAATTGWTRIPTYGHNIYVTAE